MNCFVSSIQCKGVLAANGGLGMYEPKAGWAQSDVGYNREMRRCEGDRGLLITRFQRVRDCPDEMGSENERAVVDMMGTKGAVSQEVGFFRIEIE